MKSVNIEGLETIQKRDYVSTLERALEKTNLMGTGQKSIPIPDTRQSLTDISSIANRYTRACSEGDMKDFSPWLRENARGQILEIGTRDGASTSAFLLGLDDAGEGHLTSIDVGDCSKLWNHPRWTFIRGSSLHLSFVEGPNAFKDGQFDLALIDGDHNRDAFIGDLYNCWHWVKPGGMILAHDLKPERGHEFYSVGLKEEWYKFTSQFGHLIKDNYILPGKYGLGVIVKK